MNQSAVDAGSIALDGDPLLSVVVCTYNPDAGRLSRAFAAISGQTLRSRRGPNSSGTEFELIVVDNASSDRAGLAAALSTLVPHAVRVVPEHRPGLSHARATGFRNARGSVIVLVDDDNVLSPDYLEITLASFAREPDLGLLGGRILPEFEKAPGPWLAEFRGLLALRDLGAASIRERHAGDALHFPECAPVGAGMAIRRQCALAWCDRFEQDLGDAVPDRRGSSLSSSGDNDIVLHAFRTGWAVGYEPGLSLMHLIPETRCRAGYLARLNRGIQHSWMRVLSAHGANPWPPLDEIGAMVRCARAFLRFGAMLSRPRWIRWRGACGHFWGRVPSRTSAGFS